MALITGVIGLVMLSIFLGILLWWIKALPLIIIVLSVLAIQLYDFVQEMRYGENGAGS
ncbi:MAG TPA: hypothetical protein VJL90_06795 [Pseudorhodoplanes sp.]|nr:hypothetical protein [Pseudorhodoplanes sp.]